MGGESSTATTGDYRIAPHSRPRTGFYDRKLATLARVPVLIIDDFRLKPLRPPADEDLHDLIAERYEPTGTLVTSNLDFAAWDQALPANRLLGPMQLTARGRDVW